MTTQENPYRSGHQCGRDATVVPLHRDRDLYIEQTPTPVLGTDLSAIQPIEGELLTEAENAEIDRRSAIARRLPAVQSTTAVVRRVADSPGLRTTGRATARTAFYVWTGGLAVAKRWRDAHGYSRYERQMRAAEAAGEQDRLGEWETRAEQAKQARHTRHMEWMDAPLKLAKALAMGVVSMVVALALLGVLIAASYQDISKFVAPFQAVAWMVRWTTIIVGIAWTPVLVLAPFGLLLWLRAEGRKHGAWEPAWAQTPDRQAESAESFAVVNEDMLTRALAHCKVSSLSRALKAGEHLFFDVLPRQQGGGTYVQIRLPFGVLAADFLHPDKIERLAGNLGRHKHEVYPQRQPSADARVLDLWVADQGTMDRPAPPWPLLAEGEFDVFRDRVPWGVTMRGEQVEQAMLGRHGLVAAVSKQGKTATLRIPALTLALDPTVELRIADLKGDGDWSMFTPRAHTLIEGGAEEQADATCAMLEALVENMQDRYERKRALGVRGNISRELSRAPGSGFHPIYCFIDECQVLYQAQHPVGGTKADARAWRAAKRLHDQARAVNIHLYQATQRPDPTAIPGPVREGAHVRIGLYVPNYEAAKMALADAADMGARPQDLRPGRDRVTFVATGEFDGIGEGMAFLIVKSHFVDTPDAYPVIDRAMDIIANHDRTIEQQASDTAEPTAVVDHLTNVAAVLGTEPRLRTQVVLQRLADLDPATYTDWTFTDLKEALPEVAKPFKTGGTVNVVADLVHQAITERNENGGDDTDSEATEP